MCVRSRYGYLEHYYMCPAPIIWRWGWPGEGRTVTGILPAASAQDGELVQYQAKEGGISDHSSRENGSDLGTIATSLLCELNLGRCATSISLALGFNDTVTKVRPIL